MHGAGTRTLLLKLLISALISEIPPEGKEVLLNDYPGKDGCSKGQALPTAEALVPWVSETTWSSTNFWICELQPHSQELGKYKAGPSPYQARPE